MKKIVCIGDSITYGYGLEANQCWVGILKNKSYNIQWINVGLNGDTTTGMLMRFHPHVIALQPDYVIILGGGNDLVQEASAERIFSNLQQMVKLSEEHSIIPILGIQPQPAGADIPQEWKELTDYGSVARNTHTLKDLILTYCGEKEYFCINFDDGMKEKLKNRYRHYFFDGVHPDANGHKILAQIAEEYLNKKGILQKID